MAERLHVFAVPTEADLLRESNAALKVLSGREIRFTTTLDNCCKLLAAGGAVTMVAQSNVQDPDFLAEYSAYYSRQFGIVPRYCTRLHFFRHPLANGQTPLQFIDGAPESSYVGFITLRPVVKSPVGATIISTEIVSGFIRSADCFPVNLAGREFEVIGTPFMQQDNAVGACAQASIWMALRTLRKREGDRAHDPAQITDAATKYFVSGRIRPNRQGLTQLQMIEAIRAAGYSPHMIPLGTWHASGLTEMPADEAHESMRAIHAYIESEIPVVLILFPPSGGHAVVAIGHTWDSNQPQNNKMEISLKNGVPIEFLHAVSWVPSVVIHNDNTGPYRAMPESEPGGYGFEHAAYAIPLLPVDVFMSGEEAATVAMGVLGEIFQGFSDRGETDANLAKLGTSLALRLLLVEKRKLRKWAAQEPMVAELKERLRLMDLPKRVWVMEIHLAAVYGNQAGGKTPASLVGLILVDPTGDVPNMSPLLMHLNFPALPIIKTLPHGVLLDWDPSTGTPSGAVQTNDKGPTIPIRL